MIEMAAEPDPPLLISLRRLPELPDSASRQNVQIPVLALHVVGLADCMRCFATRDCDRLAAKTVPLSLGSKIFREMILREGEAAA